ncbi:MAG TPA: LLM class F420-dependent oxidoreductase [Gammaproteobacteria bacterium]|nr:LLM class F420-dependent oxidoreductase [Gammaproteobacteria bacterium]
MVRCSVLIFPTDQTIQPVDLALAVEERGLDALFLPEHTHIPVGSSSPFMPKGVVPEFYKRTYDPFVALAACAAVTERIKLATGICLITQRSPITLAKEIASLDMIANGRVILGVGAGWNITEMENHGTQFETRWRVLRERIMAMKTIWQEDEPEFHGEYVDFDPMWSYPKPIQNGGPPIWIGANSKWAPDRVAEYADGWMPIRGRAGGGNIEALKVACERRGRDLSEITLGLFMAPLDESESHVCIAEGYDELIYNVAPENHDSVLRQLDQIAVLANKLRT